MWIQQMFIALLCTILASHQISAVVNNVQSSSPVETDSTISENSESSGSSSSTNVADSLAASSDKEATRREAPLSGGIPHEVYGPPSDTYLPVGPSNPGLPVPVYGVPTGPTNNLIYPGPPPDIPPPVISNSYGPPNLQYGPPKEIYVPPKDTYGVPRETYGPPKNTYGPPKEIYGPPKEIYGPPKEIYGPPKEIYGPPKDTYGPPKDTYGPPKDTYGPPQDTYGIPKEIYGPPKEIYGPPKEIYGPPPKNFPPPGSFPKPPKPFNPPPFYKPKPFYGPPRQQYGPPPPNKPHFKPPKQIYGVPKPQYGPPKAIYGPPKPTYGPPKQTYGPPPKIHGLGAPIYGPPKDLYGPPQKFLLDSVQHGPPHPGVPAPPTPPDIKYDGWQPIPGIVSRPPSDNYDVTQTKHHGNNDLQYNGDFVPPPISGHGISSLSLGSSYGNSAGISDSYGAPLNTVTGSGGIISTSGDAHIQNQDQSAISLGLSAAGIGGGYDGQLSVIKSIGYEIFPNGGQSSNVESGSSGFSAGNIYGAPHSESHNGHYSASHSHSNHGSSFGSYKSSNFGKGLSLSSSGIGLIPPSGLYGIPPSGLYGTPLLNNDFNTLNPPKHPVIFREPVPNGLLQSIGNQVSQKDAAGIIDNGNNFNGASYIPPPVHDFGKGDLNLPSTLYSLPYSNKPVSFQSVTHGSSSFNHQATASALTSYSGNIDSYGVPIQNNQNGVTVSLDHSLPPATIDLTHFGDSSYNGGVVHDCNAHKSQPLPQLNYGLPSGNSYTAALSSLTTNIGAGQSYDSNSLSFKNPDLQAAHSQKSTISDGASINAIEEINKEQYGKSLAESIAPGGELIKSQSIDFNNIPVQGALGSYTLQIQPADGGKNSVPAHVSHDQVLNDGLLQSILAAIEQPQQKNAQIFGQPLIVQEEGGQVSDRLQLPTFGEPQQFKEDGEAQQSVKSAVIVSAPTTETNVTESQTTEPEKAVPAETESPLQLIDNNEIALYFHNNQQEIKDESQNGDKQESEVRNGQQYGSYVSFKTPNASFVYGDLKPETPHPEQK